MKINRVFFAFVAAALLLPVTAMAQLIPTPQPGTALILASVYFDNGNDETPVTLTLACTGGSIAPSQVQVVNPQLGQYQHAFVVSQIPVEDDQGVECKVSQSALADYETEYDCAYGAYSDLPGNSADASCTPRSSTVCYFNNVQQGDTNGCVVFNDVEPVEFEVIKEWDVTNAVGAGDYYNLDATIHIYCSDNNGSWSYQESLEDSDYTDGVASVTIDVYPEYDGTSKCWADEDQEDSAVEVTSSCGAANAQLSVKVGQDTSCTINNTLFFEGIPTLNQYGMAIMALLMLGVGFVGFRRFV